MKAFLFLTFCLITFTGTSQNVTDAEEAKLVDEQVWEPFKKAYFERDAEGFNAVHTEDVMRITDDGFQIGQVYKNANVQWLEKGKDRPKRRIDFVFEHRIYSEDIAYEVGYYKISTPSEPYISSSYARFSVLLKKVEGQWKIAQDWDVDKIGERKVSAEDFNRLLPE